jgi:beta-glucosidase
LNHFNIYFVPSAREMAQWYNAVQEEARRRPLGIPVTIATDDQHSFTDNPAAAAMPGPFSKWPESLRLGLGGHPVK